MFRVQVNLPSDLWYYRDVFTMSDVCLRRRCSIRKMSNFIICILDCLDMTISYAAVRKVNCLDMTISYAAVRKVTCAGPKIKHVVQLSEAVCRQGCM